MLNPVPPTCYVDDSLRNVVERQIVRLDDPGSGGMESETHSDDFLNLLEGHPGMTAVLPRPDPAICLTWWQLRRGLVWPDTA